VELCRYGTLSMDTWIDPERITENNGRLAVPANNDGNFSLYSHFTVTSLSAATEFLKTVAIPYV